PWEYLLRARVCGRMGQMEQAQADFARATALAPDDPLLRSERSNLLGRCGRWAEAAQVAQGLPVGTGNLGEKFRTACLYAYAGDRESYRRFAQDLFQGFGRVRELRSVEPAVKICLILPEPAVDLEQLLPAADRLVAGPAANADPWHPFVKG